MFGKRLRYLRKSKGFNQVQLAEKLGVKKQSISNWENDNIMPSIDMLGKLADFFCVTTDYLLCREPRTQSGRQTLDVTGLTPQQVEHIRLLVEDLRESRR